MNTDETQEKKVWTKPELVEYGSAEEITREAKPKWWGSGDDLVSSIIS